MEEFFNYFGKIVVIALAVLAYGTLHHRAVVYEEKVRGGKVIVSRRIFFTVILTAIIISELMVTQGICGICPF